MLAIVAAAVVALLISFTVADDDVPAACYSAVSAVIPLLLIALYTAFGRDRAGVLDMSREIDRVIGESPELTQHLAPFRKPM